MKRPLASRLLPLPLQEAAYYRFFHPHHDRYAALFECAPLALAPGVAMHDLIVGDVISGNLAFHGFYEWRLSQALARRAEGGGLLVDVGANMGYFSLLWASRQAKARVLAFEAAPRNLQRMQSNIERNGLSERIGVIAKAAGRSHGSVAFDLGPPEQSGWGGITTQASPTAIQVPMVRIDEELADQAIEVLKVDVEGADTWVLQGCEKLLRRKRIRTIFFEQNAPRMQLLGIAADEARAYLDSVGYQCAPFGRDRNEWQAWPR